MNEIEISEIARPAVAVAVFAVMVGSAVWALVKRDSKLSAGLWGVATACWLPNYLLAADAPAVLSAVMLVVGVVFPAAALVLAAWRHPRGGAAAITAEVCMLFLLAIMHWGVGFASSYDFTGESTPGVEVLVYFVCIAVAFVVAGIPNPSRRIVYGSVALMLVVLGVFREWLMWSATGQHPDVPFNDDLLVAAVYLIPVLGTAVQIWWWFAVGRARHAPAAA